MQLQENYCWPLTLTLGSRSHKTMSSALYFMWLIMHSKVWSFYIQELMRRRVYKKMHYLTFDVDSRVNIIKPVVQLVSSTSCAVCTCKVWSCSACRFRRRCIYKRNTSFDLWPWSRVRCHLKRCRVRFTLYDQCPCKGWSCYVQQFKRKCIYKLKNHIKHLTLTLGSVSYKTLSSTLYIMWHTHLQSLKLLHPTV